MFPCVEYEWENFNITAVIPGHCFRKNGFIEADVELLLAGGYGRKQLLLMSGRRWKRRSVALRFVG